MIPRIYVGADRVAISRPGYNVFGPTISYATMAFDTLLPPTERPIIAGVIYNRTIASGPAVGYPTTYSLPPFPVVTRKFAGTQNYYVSPARGNGANSWQGAYSIVHTTTYFQIQPPPTVFADPDWNVPFDWVYVVYRAEPFV